MKEQRAVRTPERVLEALRDVGAPSRPEADLETHRNWVDAIERAIRRGPEHARRRRAGMMSMLGLAAALALGIGGAWIWSRAVVAPADSSAPAPRPAEVPAVVIRNASGTVVADRKAGAIVVSSGDVRSLAEGTKITTALDSQAKLELPPGVLVDVSETTELIVAAVRGLESRLSLRMGRVVLEVPRLGAGRRVVVETPDAQVVVRGTKFIVDVRLLGSQGERTTLTSVQVVRGSVFVVRNGSESIVSAGESWSSAPDSDAPVSAPPIDLDLSEPMAAASASAEPSVQAETLTEENRLFQEALDARNGGDNVKAIRLLGDFLARFPRSTVAHEARVERFRTLDRIGDRSGAVSEARRYLQEYPRGSVVREAREIVERGRE